MEAIFSAVNLSDALVATGLLLVVAIGIGMAFKGTGLAKRAIKTA